MTRRLRGRLALAAFALAAIPGVGVAQSSTPELLVSTDWLAQRLRDPAVVILHVGGQKAEYDVGHVPGARWFPFQSFTPARGGLSTELPDAALLDSLLEAAGVGESSRIIITGSPITMTARLFYTLDYFGLGARTSLLDGGIDAWREEGRPLERRAPSVTRGSVSLRPQPQKLADAAALAQPAATGPRVAVIDARAPEFFAGLLTNNTPRTGSLPTASNLPFNWLTGEFSRYRDRERLQRLFTGAGVKPGDRVVAYCHIGMQASVVYLAARLLGYDAAVYDGSFEDWSRRAELPIRTAPPPDNR